MTIPCHTRDSPRLKQTFPIRLINPRARLAPTGIQDGARLATSGLAVSRDPHANIWFGGSHEIKNQLAVRRHLGYPPPLLFWRETREPPPLPFWPESCEPPHFRFGGRHVSCLHFRFGGCHVTSPKGVSDPSPAHT